MLRIELLMMFSRQRILIFSAFILAIWLSFGIFIYKSSFKSIDKIDQFITTEPLNNELESCKLNNQKLRPGFWGRVNLQKYEIPQSIKEMASKATVKSESIAVQGVHVHYIYSKPKEAGEIPVLLLHGKSYTSEIWNELGTITLLSALGFYPVAIDLPGFGDTPIIRDLNKVYFLDDLLSSLNLKKPVFISPSMSGYFSLEYLVDYPEKIGGFVPVSPVHTNVLHETPCEEEEAKNFNSSMNGDCKRLIPYLKIIKPNLSCIKVPSLIVWGEKDRDMNSANLCLLPESQGAEIPEGKHSAYLSNPDLWHKLLYNFLKILNDTQTCR